MSGGAPGADGLTLAVEASSYRGSVAVVRGTTVVAEATVAMRGATEERLMPAVAAAIAEAGGEPATLARIVCGGGPGSFTSLRIAAAIAKGLCVAHGTPLLAVSSLLLVAAGGDQPLAPGGYLVVTDAMRDERFAVEVRVAIAGVPVLASAPRRLDGAAVTAWAAEGGLVRIGPGEAMERWPHARGVAVVLPELLGSPAVESGSWEPAYGRLAEAQVKWETAHGRALPTG
ncbi:MAG: tRNA (adenosine(37)-N6)-threonylcarbamoyltransferase complex dimerization subunit type 1 TsaB [Gemmatimonadaceae bacterium]